MLASSSAPDSSFDYWRSLAPGVAAREVHARVRTRLRPDQQRAAIAHLADENRLATELAAASSAASERMGTTTAPLRGLPYFTKDLFNVTGMPTYAGSTFLPEVRSSSGRNAVVVDTLRRAGAVCAGKTHLHEFAYGITGENPHYGDCEHPFFPGRTSGGSSSGSAAAVAAGVVPLALGTDTGGSVRLPAAFCGLFGFRLAPGDAWIGDAVPLAPSFDTSGWFTAHAADLRDVIAALVGLEPATHTPRGCALELDGLDADVATTFRGAATQFAPAADTTTAAALRSGFARSVETYNIIVAAEAWAFHAPWGEKYRHRYDPAVWQRLERGRALTAAEIDGARTQLEASRTLWAEFFRTYDFLVLPASPTPALTKAECTLENRVRILNLTAPASLGGLPVLTLPWTLPSGLTTGLQVIVNQPKSPVIDWALRALE